MRKVVFLDRDGVINYEPGSYTCSTEDFIINDGVGEVVKRFKENDFLVIVISNQGGIAKGLYAKEDVMQMHAKFCEYLKEYNASVDDFYFCPHHQSTGKCLCRKPENLLLEKAIAVYNIDPKKSFFIGDSERDIEAAEKSGVIGILVKPNENLTLVCKRILNF
jgi:D-glycero-D-manno-heptose 1,7-bisphosphate phosphatase